MYISKKLSLKIVVIMYSLIFYHNIEPAAPLVMINDPINMTINANALCGTVEPNLNLDFQILSGISIGTGISDSLGDWNFTPASGNFVLSATAYNNDGTTNICQNPKTSQANVIINTLDCNLLESTIGTNFFMNIVFNSPQVLTGTAEPGSKVVFSINGEEIASMFTYTNALGYWTYELPQTGGAYTSFNVVIAGTTQILETQIFGIGIDAPQITTEAELETAVYGSTISTVINSKYCPNA